MAVTSKPPVGPPVQQSPFTGTRQQQINNVAAALGKYGSKMVNQWTTFAAQMGKSHPELSVKQDFQAFLDTLVASGLASGIAKQLGVVAQLPEAAASAAAKATSQDFNLLNPLNWLSSLGGMIASGLEAGVIALLKDIWKIMVGPVEIMAGASIIFISLALAFGGDLLKLAIK